MSYKEFFQFARENAKDSQQIDDDTVIRYGLLAAVYMRCSSLTESYFECVHNSAYKSLSRELVHTRCRPAPLQQCLDENKETGINDLIRAGQQYCGMLDVEFQKCAEDPKPSCKKSYQAFMKCAIYEYANRHD